MATTKTDPKLSIAAAESPRPYEGLRREQLIEAYRIMYTSRRIDDREILLKRQQKIFFQMSGAGHEAIGCRWNGAETGLRLVLSVLSRSRVVPGDWSHSREMLLAAVGAADDPSSGGRQMPSHWGRAG